jgi:hypothetical protein
MKSKITTTKRPIKYSELKIGDIFQWLNGDEQEILMLCEDFFSGVKHNVLLSHSSAKAGVIYQSCSDAGTGETEVIKLDGIIEAHWVV